MVSFKGDIYRCSQIFDFYLFVDDTNLLYSDKDLNDLETVVNKELIKVGVLVVCKQTFFFTLVNLTLLYSILTNTNQTARFN